MIVAPRRFCRRGRALAAALAVTALLGPACGGGLQFAKDSSLTIDAPRDLQGVSLPVHLRWTAKLPSRPQAQYAVFVDVLPVHPGQNLRAVAGSRCAGVPSCVDEALLNRHSVYLAREPQLDLQTLPILGPPKGEPDVHQATIVLVDANWRRLGESAWRVTFVLRHDASP